MTISQIQQLVVEFEVKAVRQRLWQIIPGLLSWSTLIILTVLAFTLPFWVAIFIIVYDIYIFIRALYMTVHLVYAYRRLKTMLKIDWLARCQKAQGHLPWHSVHHLVIFPTYNESLQVLRTSLAALTKVNFPKENLHVVVGFEDRSGPQILERAQTLSQEFSSHFATFLTTVHPDGLPGEKRVKSANATWALKKIEKIVIQKGIQANQILVNNFDSDTIVNPQYFACLTHTFITHPDPYHVSYQPLPMYHNNVWDAPAFSRVIAAGSTFWQMIESTRPERLVTFSSHSMTLQALRDVGYWQKNIVSEDSRIFWQCLLQYHGHYSTEPLYTTVSMDAALGATWWQTLKNQYKQKRRWAWGIENFPYIAEGFWRDRKIPRRAKFRYVFRTLEGHYSWATAPIIVAGLGWLPIFFGGAEFHSTVLSYSLPHVTRTIMTLAMAGLIVSSVLTYVLLPQKPAEYGRWRYLGFFWQWALIPFIATLLSALPALDAETRLMLGRDLHFNVMEKARKRDVV